MPEVAEIEKLKTNAGEISVDALVTLTEASRLAKRSVERLRYLADTGRLRMVKIGGRRLLFREDVVRYAPMKSRHTKRR